MVNKEKIRNLSRPEREAGECRGDSAQTSSPCAFQGVINLRRIQICVFRLSIERMIIRVDEGLLTETKDEDCPRHIDDQNTEYHPRQHIPSLGKFGGQNYRYRSIPASLPHSSES